MKKQLVYIMVLTVIMDISLLYTRSDRLQIKNQGKFKTYQNEYFKSASQLYLNKNKSKFKNLLKNSKRKKSFLKTANISKKSFFGKAKRFLGKSFKGTKKFLRSYFKIKKLKKKIKSKKLIKGGSSGLSGYNHSSMTYSGPGGGASASSGSAGSVDVSSYLQQIAHLQSQLNNQNNIDLENIIDIKDENMQNDLKLELVRLSKRLQIANNEKISLQHKNEMLSSELGLKKQDLDNIKVELNDYKVTHEQYDLKIQFLNTEKNEQAKQYHLLKQHFDEKEGTFSDVSTLLTNVQSDLQTQMQKNEYLQAQSLNNNKKILELEQKIRETEKDVESKKADYEKLQTENAGNIEKIRNQDKKISELDQKIKESETDLESKKADYEKLRTENVYHIQKLEDEANGYESDKFISARQIVEYQSQIKQLNEQLKDTIDNNQKELKSQLDQKDNQINALKKETAELLLQSGQKDNVLKEKNIQIQKLEDEKQDLQLQIKSNEDKINLLESTIQDLNYKMENQETINNGIHQELEAVRSSLKRIKGSNIENSLQNNLVSSVKAAEEEKKKQELRNQVESILASLKEND